jgi:class 3 adenylate cyclase
MSADRLRVLVLRLAQGWVFTAISFVLLNFFPRVEWEIYDSRVLEYRTLPLRFSFLSGLFNRYGSYTGLHRSISLVGDQDLRSEDSLSAHLEALRRYRRDLAAAACWIVDSEIELPKDLSNGPLEESLVFAVPTQTRWNVLHSEQPPFVLRPSEADGVIREIYLAMKESDGSLKPCLPLVLYARFLELGDCSPEVVGGRLRLGDRNIPVNEDDLGYSLPYFPYVSALRAHTKMDETITSVTDPMEPLRLVDALKMPENFFGQRVYRRFYFLGNYSMTAVGERATPTGPFRDFQIAAMGLDTLIQGPYLRWVSGWPCLVYYFTLSSLLALWLLSPSSLPGRFLRVGQFVVAWYVCGLGICAAGYYLPMAWQIFYVLLLTSWIVGRIWLTTMGYLRRYGGTAAARLLEMGHSHLDHSEAEERLVTIVFVGLPAHLRQQELEDDPHLLEHRQLFSLQVAEITHRFDGIVHDFQADYLMLGFGTHPGLPDPNHAQKAFWAAQQLIACSEKLQAAWQSQVPQGARVQVSVNTGLVAVGWVGTSKYKRSSAAIGDTTNVAARLLGTAKKLDLDLIVSHSAYELLHGQAEFIALPPVMLKGKSEAVAIYKLAGPP